MATWHKFCVSPVGNQFDLVTLSLVLGESINKTASVLESAMMEGLITPLGASYKVMVFDVPGLEDQVNASYKFAHDRIQQALYSLISADDQSSIHWRIGQLLVCRVLMQDDGQSSEYVPDGSSYSRAVASLPRLDEGQRGNLVRMLGDLFFDVVNHLNLGRQFIVQRDELYEVGSLNLVAGKKARQSAAYGPAYRYVQTAIELLMHHPVADGNPWEHHYDLMLALHVEAASAAYLSGLFVDMEQLIVVVQQQAHSLLDKVAVYEIEFQAHIARNRLVEAIHTGLHVLALLGCSLPEKPDHATIGATLAETRALVQHYTIDDIIVLPPMEDAVGCASMRVLSSLTTPAYQAMPQLLPLVVCNMVTLSLTRGNTSESIFAYAMYGLMLCGVVEDLDTGYHFGQLALKLLERSDARDSTARTLHVVECNVMHWKEHVLSTLRPLQEAYRSGLETGDFGFAALACMCYSYHSYFAGQELTLLAREMDAYRDSLQQMRQDTVLHFHQIYHQAVLNMLGRSKHPCLLQGEAYDEEKMLPLHIAANQRTALFVLYLNKLVLCYLAREYVWALECSAMAEEYMDGAVGLLLIPVFYLHDSLSRLARCAEVDQAERQSLLERVGLNQEKMQRWARHSPANHLHKFYLVEAERARVLVRDGDAREWYDKAIALARENQYLNEEALAYELAGMFYLAKGQPRVAHIYLYDAHYAYRCWGAAIRVQDLEQRYPQVFQHTTLLPSEGGAINSNTTLFETSQESTMVLDLNSLMKAVQAISSEIVLSKLLSKMMHIVLENAAAERGLLLLEWHGQWSIEVEGTIDGVVETVLHAIPLDAPHAPQLPLHLINYVIRTQQNVVINDAAASEGQFAQDMYIRTYQPRSILCAPLIHQGKMTGVLYLENYLSSGAFTPDRVQVLNVLSSHAAISIENARLYAELQTNEKKYRTLFEESKDVIFISTLDGYLIDFNPVTSLYSGYSEEELRRVPVRNFYANPDKMRQFREMMAQYGSVRDFEIQLRAKDGTLKDALITATQHYAEDGTLIGYQGIIRDMTEHKRAEQEKLRLIAIERELTLARDIQRNLLPPARPAWAGLDVVCYSAPVHAVGGDFYAYYTFDPTSSEPIKRYAIAVGDVAGNGMPAALLMAFSLASFHSTVRQRVAPDEFLAHMDNAIAEYTHATNQHCALVYMDITVPSVRVLPRGEHSLPGAVVPPGAGGTLPVPGHRHDSSVVGTVRFANAGCVLPIVKRASGMVRWVDVIGVPLGVGMGTRFDYKMATLELSSGDMIILSSDGVIEATGPDRELFGFDRLEHAIREGPDTSASAMLGHLRAAIGAFVGEQESHDDMTLVVIQV